MPTDKKIPPEIKKFVEGASKIVGEGVVILPEFGIGIVREKPDVISTGSSSIDEVLGIGGLPRGRIVEILGSESSGKTTLALSTIAQAQMMGLRAGYIDTEQSLDRNRAVDLGVNFDAMVISQPDTAEKALDLLELMVASKTFGVVVLDSVAALVPQAELEETMVESSIGLQARLMSKILRKVVSPANKNNVLLIFINQLRQKIGGFFPIEVPAGGNALKYYASIRIDMRKNAVKERVSFTEHTITIKKNKFSIPGQKVIVRIGKHGFIEKAKKD